MSTATTTLATTTLLATVERGDTQVLLASLTGIVKGACLWVDRELMCVEYATGINTYVVVRRGIEGTGTRRHGSNSTVYIGRGDQFYVMDPLGLPADAPVVTPYINLVTGVAWAVQGDDTGPGADGRSWQPITTSQSIGALGVRVNTTTTPS